MKPEKEKRLLKARVKLASRKIIGDAENHGLMLVAVEGNTVTLKAFRMVYDQISETGLITGHRVPLEGPEHIYVLNVVELLEGLEDFSFVKNKSKRQRKRRRELLKRNLEERLAFIKDNL